MTDERLGGWEAIALKEALSGAGVDVPRLESYLERNMGLRTTDEKAYRYAVLFVQDELGQQVVEADVGADFDGDSFWEKWDDVVDWEPWEDAPSSGNQVALAIRFASDVDISAPGIQTFSANARSLWQQRVAVIVHSADTELVPGELRRSLPAVSGEEGGGD